MKLPLASQMQALETLAFNRYKIPSLVLMENAGVSTVNHMENVLGPCENSFCPIFIGPGNNGGDGLVIGRHLFQRGCQVVFFFLISPQKITGDPEINLNVVTALNLPCHLATTVKEIENIPSLLKPYTERGVRLYAIVDAIFGIGLCRKVEGHYRAAIEMINQIASQRNAPTLAVDIPSGLNADTGQVMGTAVRADHTATFGCVKPGHFLTSGKKHTGAIKCFDIGIPPEVFQEFPINTAGITPRNLQPAASQLQRDTSSHKGSHGHLLIVAGAKGSSGAAVLAARGALRTGAGLVTISSTQQNDAIFQTTVPEAMTFPLKHSAEHLSGTDWPELKKSLEKYTCIVLGPGLGQHKETVELVLHLFHDAPIPIIVDADALNILAAYRERLHLPSGTRIFTPHPGELARLCKCSVNDVLADIFTATRKACAIFTNKKHPTVMITKGPGTIVYSSEQRHFINTTGNPSMATGGMGDVLSGMIGALMCQKLSPLMAAACGVYLHGLAADILDQQIGTGLYASEVADTIPAARHQLINSMKKIEDSREND